MKEDFFALISNKFDSKYREHDDYLTKLSSTIWKLKLSSAQVHL